MLTCFHKSCKFIPFQSWFQRLLHPALKSYTTWIAILPPFLSLGECRVSNLRMSFGGNKHGCSIVGLVRLRLFWCRGSARWGWISHGWCRDVFVGWSILGHFLRCIWLYRWSNVGYYLLTIVSLEPSFDYIDQSLSKMQTPNSQKTSKSQPQ